MIGLILFAGVAASYLVEWLIKWLIKWRRREETVESVIGAYDGERQWGVKAKVLREEIDRSPILAAWEKCAKEATSGEWRTFGTPLQGAMEAAPGISIGSPDVNTEPICRVHGYLLPVEANAAFIANFHPARVLLMISGLRVLERIAERPCEKISMGYVCTPKMPCMTCEARAALQKLGDSK